MQRLFVAILSLLVVAAVSWALWQQRQLSDLQEKLAGIMAERSAAAAVEKQAQSDLAALLEKNAFLSSERDGLRQKIQDQPKSEMEADTDVAARPKAKSPMQGFAKMMENPEMKKMIHAQIETQVRVMFGDLTKRWKMSPQDSDQVMALLAQKMEAASQSSMSMFGGEKLDPAAKREAMEKMKADIAVYDEQLKSLLGDERYQELQDYERTTGDRMLLQQYEVQFNAAGTPLQSGQREALLKIMADERLKTPAAGTNAGFGGGPSPELLSSDDGMKHWMQSEADYQKRVMQSVVGTLNPDQANTLQKAFTQQAQMMEMGIKMSREMLKDGEDGGETFILPASPVGLPPPGQ